MEHCNKPGLMPIKQAIDTMCKVVQPCTDKVDVPLHKALGATLAESIIARNDVPPADNSAMDGYAVKWQESLAKTQLTVVDSALAGHPSGTIIEQGQAIRIMTGAPLPIGADTVIMQENVTALATQQIEINHAPLKKGENVRKAGEDIAKGEIVVSGGTPLKPADLALLASLGVPSVTIYRPLKVALFANGDELVEAGKSLSSGQIYESNRTALRALLSRMNAQVIDFGIIADDPVLIREAFTLASQQADVIISCGGVSVGEADFVKQQLVSLGEINFWKVAIKPGKPFAFGMVGQTPFFGLPGNPVSSYVTFEKLVKPVLQRMQGSNVSAPLRVKAQLSEPLYKRPGRADFQRAIWHQDNQHRFFVAPLKKQGSGVMSSITRANCYIVTDIPEGNLPAGSLVDIELFHGI